MNHDVDTGPHARFGLASRKTPWVVFAIALLFSGVLGWLIKHAVDSVTEARLDAATAQLTALFEKRVQAYVNALEDTRGLFHASEVVTRREFKTFVDGLELQADFPGVQGIGYAVTIPVSRLAEHERRVRAEGLPIYRVWPVYPRNAYTAILFLEPLDWRNRRALGYDMLTESVRREAMVRASDTGQTTVSRAVTLVQEVEDDRQPGFLIYAPLYARGQSIETVQERRANLLGWLYSPFRAHDLFGRLYAEQAGAPLEFAVFTHAGERLYTSPALQPSGPKHLQKLVTFHMANQEWTLLMQAPGTFGTPLERNAPRVVLAFSLTISLLILSVLLALRAQTDAERKLRMQATAAQEIAEQAAAQRSEFLSITAHELRTPVAALLLQIQVLDRQLRTGNFQPEALRRALDLAERQVRKLANLIEDLLAVTRIQSGRLELRKEAVALADLVREVLERLAETLQARQIEVRFTAEPGVIGTWDRYRLDQVVMNLLTNAMKYGQGKPIDVRVSRHATFAELSVRDYGVGIPKEDQQRIFERFERARTTQAESGLGLGLYIANQIVKQHGGSIEVRSEPGQGAEFVVRLPIETAVL